MHVAPMVVIPHRLGPEGWLQALRHLAETLEDRPGIPLTVRLPGAAVEHPATGDHLAAVREHQVLWLAGGYSDPSLVMLPDHARRAHLLRERTAMEAAGITPGGLWVGGGWAPDLVSLAGGEGLDLIFADVSLFPSLPSRPGAVERAGESVVVVAVTHQEPEATTEDGLVTVAVEVEGLPGLAGRFRGCLLDPPSYLAGHRPGPRLSPRTTTVPLDTDTEPLYRRMLLLTGDHGDRTPGRDDLLTLQSSELVFDPAAAGQGHVRLLRARIDLDGGRRRGDTWVEVRSVDWDADGEEEIHVETAETSLVVDPAAATVEIWDDKTTCWPIAAVEPFLPGVLVRRLMEDGREPSELLRPATRSEGRGEARLGLEGEAGTTCTIVVGGGTVEVMIETPGREPARLGPEMPVALGRSRLRVDGGDWLQADRPLAVTGHRFRLTDGDRTLLVSAPRPCELFTRPLEGRGLMIWPHWITSGPSAYQVQFTPS